MQFNVIQEVQKFFKAGRWDGLNVDELTQIQKICSQCKDNPEYKNDRTNFEQNCLTTLNQVRWQGTSFNDVTKLLMSGYLLRQSERDLLEIQKLCAIETVRNDQKIPIVVESISTELNRRQNEKLAEHVFALIQVADSQKRVEELLVENTKSLSEQNKILINESKSLGKYTVGLFWLTVMLAILTVILVAISLPDFLSKIVSGHK